MNRVLAIAGVVIRELYRRKDFYVLFVLTALITLLLGAVNFFNDPKIVRYLKEVCLLLIWISAVVIAVTTTARQIPSEKENRTIFPLLAKPVTRWEVILGKFAGCWLAAGIALLVFYLFFAVISESRGGEGTPAPKAAAATQVAPGPQAHDDHAHEPGCCNHAP
ncbi:MAG: ABC transporter permease, partial [Verrucomicrobiales bacterium]|nr:ABC transporter permease [Verrucomicrobiales bacterium]